MSIPLFTTTYQSNYQPYLVLEIVFKNDRFRCENRPGNFSLPVVVKAAVITMLAACAKNCDYLNRPGKEEEGCEFLIQSRSISMNSFEQGIKSNEKVHGLISSGLSLQE